MFRKRLEEVSAWLQTQGENLDRRERAYKLEGAARVHARLQTFLTDPGVTQINVQPPQELNLLSWQIVDGLNTMIKGAPEVFRSALSVLWTPPLDPGRADQFWSVLDPALDTLSETQRKHFSGVGTRASVTSYFLFLADPLGHPFYRPSFGGKAVEWLYDKKDGLDKRTLGNLLTDYVGRCRYLHQQFRDAGVPLRDMLDTQGALYIISSQYLDGQSRKK
ncbi:hypothetical protein [Deinococcus aestuarii]|uniref:hypothetical protein n=1 Tax=Deinococcus aestuarii TaxID=2774531 RepID=UPI001C0AE1D5|nr:hypothetical protein [Deinococcus aestuarii]